MTAPADTTSRPASATVWKAGLLTAVVGAVATTLVYLIGGLTPASWQVEQPGGTATVAVFQPAVATVVAVLAGTALLWLLRRWSWGVTAWTVLAVVVGVGSVSQPLLAAADLWTGALLGLMHLLALAAALLLLRPAARRDA